MKKIYGLFCCFWWVVLYTHGQGFLSDRFTRNAFPLVGEQGAAPIYFDKGDDWLVGKSVDLLREDIKRTTGAVASVIFSIAKVGRRLWRFATELSGSRGN